jgi:hypothetical protein
MLDEPFDGRCDFLVAEAAQRLPKFSNNVLVSFASMHVKAQASMHAPVTSEYLQSAQSSRDVVLGILDGFFHVVDCTVYPNPKVEPLIVVRLGGSG